MRHRLLAAWRSLRGFRLSKRLTKTRSASTQQRLRHHISQERLGLFSRAGDLHHQALRALGNRFVGIQHGCLRHYTAYSEDTAWAYRQTTQAA